MFSLIALGNSYFSAIRWCLSFYLVLLAGSSSEADTKPDDLQRHKLKCSTPAPKRFWLSDLHRVHSISTGIRPLFPRLCPTLLPSLSALHACVSLSLECMMSICVARINTNNINDGSFIVVLFSFSPAESSQAV